MQCLLLEHETIENPQSTFFWLIQTNPLNWIPKASIEWQVPFLRTVHKMTQTYTHTLTHVHIMYCQCVQTPNGRIQCTNTEWWHLLPFQMLMEFNGDSRCSFIHGMESRSTEINCVQLKSKSNKIKMRKTQQNWRKMKSSQSSSFYVWYCFRYGVWQMFCYSITRHKVSRWSRNAYNETTTLHTPNSFKPCVFQIALVLFFFFAKQLLCRWLTVTGSICVYIFIYIYMFVWEYRQYYINDKIQTKKKCWGCDTKKKTLWK